MDLGSWITITILVNFIALIFQLGAYVAPMWVWYQSSNVYVGVGLWYIVGCGTTTTCATTIGTDAGSLTTALFNTHGFLALRVLQSVGLAGVLALAVFLIVYKLGVSGKWNSMSTVNTAAFVICLFTILVLVASACVYAAYFWAWFLFFNTADKTSLPWSAMMSLLAAIILIVVCIFIRAKCQQENFGGALPMSGDSKMELHPQLTNGEVHRYYNQTPYRDERERYVVEDQRYTRSNRGYDDEYEDRRNDSRKFDRDDRRYDDRRNGSYEQRTSYTNRGYNDQEPTVLYNKPASREFKENRDREMGHTVYTGNGVSYLKGETNRYDRDDKPYGRQIALVENQRENADDLYYDHLRRSSRPPVAPAIRGTPASNVYIYRPHQGYN